MEDAVVSRLGAWKRGVGLESCLRLVCMLHHVKLDIHRILASEARVWMFHRKTPRRTACLQQALQVDTLPPPSLPPNARLLPPSALDRAPAGARQPHALVGPRRVRAGRRPLRRQQVAPRARGFVLEVVARD